MQTVECCKNKLFSDKIEIDDITYTYVQRYKIFFQHKKRNFVSPTGHVMVYLKYKHQGTTKPFHFYVTGKD